MVSAANKPAYLYFLRDHDPSGDKIFKSAVASLIRYAPRHTEIHVEQLAVTPEQIRTLKLPTRPTKIKGNTHATNWKGGRSVEVDAIRQRSCAGLSTPRSSATSTGARSRSSKSPSAANAN